MKKNILLLALVAALVFMLIGCGEAFAPRAFDGWTLSDLFGDAPFNANNNTLQSGFDSAGLSMLQVCGSASEVTFKTSGGGLSGDKPFIDIQAVALTNYGRGIDLKMSEFVFVPGDKIQVLVYVTSVIATPTAQSPRIALNAQPGGWNDEYAEKDDDIDDNEWFAIGHGTGITIQSNKTYLLYGTVTDKNITGMNDPRYDSPAGLRIQGEGVNYQILDIVLNGDDIEVCPGCCYCL